MASDISTRNKVRRDIASTDDAISQPIRYMESLAVVSYVSKHITTSLL